MRAAGGLDPHMREDSGTLKHPSKDPSPPIPPKVSVPFGMLCSP